MRECVGDHAIALSDQRNHEIGEKKNALYRTTWFGQILQKSEMANEKKKKLQNPNYHEKETQSDGSYGQFTTKNSTSTARKKNVNFSEARNLYF